jgi:CBS domain-containing protein
MEKNLIYRNQKTIDSTLNHYRKVVPVLQSAIDDLKAEGITLTDETLYDLVTGGAKTRAQIETDIKNEMGKLRFMVLKKELSETLAPLLQKVTEAVKKANKAMVHNGVSEYLVLDPDDFTCHDLTVGLVPDLEYRITERNSLYDTDPATKEAYRLAGEVCDKLNELEAFLCKHGDALHPISREAVVIRGELIAYGVSGVIRIGTQDGGYAELNNGAFGSINWRQP